jgi:glutamate-ammonia-ligase adenylyltransferase
MNVNKKTYKKISEAALNTSDPERAVRNLERFFEHNIDTRLIAPHLSITAKLFAASQFLANYCITHPEELSSSIKERKKDLTKKLLKERAIKEITFDKYARLDDMMRVLRQFKKRYLLRITIRDITGETDIQSSMDELTILAEIIISEALEYSWKFMTLKYGMPSESVITLVAVGKLGGEELNYSSDIDLMAVYDNDDGQTSGIPNQAGVIYNKITNHEFSCKVTELLSKLLSSQTEDGIAYRVDMRLRPQGQKGDIALPLKAYRTYYESWGRTWERMMLIRARPVAGDMKLGQAFIDAIRPFLWREALDYSEIEEIRGLKKKIDSTFSRDDIKRGYGGIRETEFFIQTFQLLYGGQNSSLRSYRILNAIQALKWMKKVPEEDLTILWDNYLYLRRVEHYLQMREDLQTHTLPSSDAELEILGKKMGFHCRDDFLENLRVRRMQIKSMYNFLLGTQEDAYTEALNLLEGGLKDNELTGYLSFRKVKEPGRCVKSFKTIKEYMRIFRTSQERSLARQVVPQLLENALTAENPDRAIAGIERMVTAFGIKTAHLMAFREHRELLTGVVKIFSLSPYLTRIVLSTHYYLDILIEEWGISKTLRVMENKLRQAAGSEDDISSRLARYRRFEEVRLGILLLLNIVKDEDLFKGLSQVAEAIIRYVLESSGCKDLSVIALGKLGGREMTFGSDLDIVFVSQSGEAMSAAEKIIKWLTTYTDLGLLYDVDMRLRPDGSKGVLVNNLEGYRNYYLEKAHDWELQALLKARPVGGNALLARSFIDMAREIIIRKGRYVKRADVAVMRERIVKDLSRESEGIDIKLGPGGIEEIEFYVQYLQLHHAHRAPGILVQNTMSAIGRMAKEGLMSSQKRDTLSATYKYFRKIQILLRLNEADVLTENTAITELAATIMEYGPPEEFADYLRRLRYNVLAVINKV